MFGRPNVSESHVYSYPCGVDVRWTSVLNLDKTHRVRVEVRLTGMERWHHVESHSFHVGVFERSWGLRSWVHGVVARNGLAPKSSAERRASSPLH
jgi:hypothetical protein